MDTTDADAIQAEPRIWAMMRTQDLQSALRRVKRRTRGAYALAALIALANVYCALVPKFAGFFPAPVHWIVAGLVLIAAWWNAFHLNYLATPVRDELAKREVTA